MKNGILPISVFALIIAFVFIACNSNPKTEATKIAKVDTAKPESKPQDPAVTATLLAQFNSLEKVFDNQNWMRIKDKDTTFLYFSRLNNFFALTHSYRMRKGDSADLRIDTIRVNENNQIIWNWNDKGLILGSATEFTNSWSNGDQKVAFNKMDGSNLLLNINGDDKNQLSKTITLSSFLVRSFYDYQHGTKLAFDKTDFTKKK
jgi:hypothetical protein